MFSERAFFIESLFFYKLLFTFGYCYTVNVSIVRKQDPNEIRLYVSLSNEIPNFKRRKLSQSRLKQILFVIENLEGFNKTFFGPHILTDLIEFGYWLKTDRTYGSIIRKGMGNSSVMTCKAPTDTAWEGTGMKYWLVEVNHQH